MKALHKQGYIASLDSRLFRIVDLRVPAYLLCAIGRRIGHMNYCYEKVGIHDGGRELI